MDRDRDHYIVIDSRINMLVGKYCFSLSSELQVLKYFVLGKFHEYLAMLGKDISCLHFIKSTLMLMGFLFWGTVVRFYKVKRFGQFCKIELKVPFKHQIRHWKELVILFDSCWLIVKSGFYSFQLWHFRNFWKPELDLRRAQYYNKGRVAIMATYPREVDIFVDFWPIIFVALSWL